MPKKTINLKYAGTCADCGAHLPVGAPAKYYGRGRVYGTECHPDTRGKASGGRSASGERSGGVCEDAPCCGCCGPQGDGDYYGTAAAEAAMEPYDDSPW